VNVITIYYYFVVEFPLSLGWEIAGLNIISIINTYIVISFSILILVLAHCQKFLIYRMLFGYHSGFNATCSFGVN
jgi:hypothetical protein